MSPSQSGVEPWAPDLSLLRGCGRDLVLVADTDGAWPVFAEPVRRLAERFVRAKVFRSVRTFVLLHTEEGLEIREGLSGDGPAISTEVLRASEGPGARRVFAVISDCTGAGWWDQRMPSLLDELGPGGVIFQTLPSEYWSLTALGQASGIPKRADEDEPLARPVPVIPLDGEEFVSWARSLVGGELPASWGVRLPKTPAPPDLLPDDAVGLVRHFLAQRSLPTQRLAVLCSMVPSPYLTPALIRSVREALLPEATIVHEAELLLGGLLVLDEAPPEWVEEGRDEAVLVFHQGAAAELRRRGTPVDIPSVVRAAWDWLEGRGGRASAFQAAVGQMERGERVAVGDDPFALAARERLVELSGLWSRPVEAHTFFLAHPGTDERAQELSRRLVGAGVRCSFDGDDGDEWLEIRKRRASASHRKTAATLVLVSPRYAPEYYLYDEVHAALVWAREDGGAHRVIPIFVDGVPADGSVPYGLSAEGGYDLSALGMDALVERLAARAEELGPGPKRALPALPPPRRDRKALFSALCQSQRAPTDLVDLLGEELPEALRPSPGVGHVTLRWACDVVQWAALRGEAAIEALWEAAGANASHLLRGAPGSDPLAWRVFEAGGLRIEAVWVPAGTFWMGASQIEGEEGYDPQAFGEEAPRHRVTIPQGFWLGRFPVTNAQLAPFVRAASEDPRWLGERRFREPWVEWFPRHPFGPEHPAVGVTWYGSMAFCWWLSERLGGVVVDLPTEAEWEWAARGEDGRRYPWGDEPPDERRARYGWAEEDPDIRRRRADERFGTAPVGERPAGRGPFGAEEQAGNVWEWCKSVYRPYEPGDRTDDWRTDDIMRHEGDRPDEAPRVLRGGSWRYPSGRLRAAYRLGLHPGHRGGDCGFRVVFRSPSTVLDP